MDYETILQSYNGEDKTRAELIAEVKDLRDQLAALESLITERGEIPAIGRPPRTADGRASTRMMHVNRGNGVGSTVASLAYQRQRAYVHLRQNGDLLRAIMESLGEGVFAVDHEGRFTSMNRMTKTLLGWAGGELMGKDIHARIHPNHAHEEADGESQECLLLRAWREGTMTRHEDIFVRKDGTPVQVSYVSSPIISDSQVVGYVVSFHDISERKWLQDALRRSERDAVARAGMLETIVEAMHDAILVFNKEGRIIHANTAAWAFFRHDTETTGIDKLHERMARYAVRDADGNLLPNDETPLFRMLRGESLTHNDSVDIFIRTPDGRQVEVNICGAPFHGETGDVEGAVCIVRDVTNLRQAERATRKSAMAALQQAATLEAIFDALPDIVLVYDQHGHILRGNAAAQEFLGQQDTYDLLDMNARDRATHYDLRNGSNEQLQESKNPVIRVLAGETISSQHAANIVYRDQHGVEWHVDVSGAPLHDAEGNNCGAVCVFKVIEP